MQEIIAYSYDSYIRQFEQAKDKATAFILSLDEYTFLRRPAPDNWCIAECFSHLQNFGTIYLENIRQGLNTAAYYEANSEVAFPPRLYWKWIASWFEPPYRIKVKTFRPFEPESVAGCTRHQLLEEFISLQDQFIIQLEEAREQRYDLGKVKVRNPVFTFAKMKLSECYTVIIAHQRRHFWQAEHVLKMLKSE